jgi:ubiquitin-protein ligase
VLFPLQTLIGASLAVRSLLATPNAADPWNVKAAKLMLEHPEEYVTIARRWNTMYAVAEL